MRALIILFFTRKRCPDYALRRGHLSLELPRPPHQMRGIQCEVLAITYKVECRIKTALLNNSLTYYFGKF